MQEIQVGEVLHIVTRPNRFNPLIYRYHLDEAICFIPLRDYFMIDLYNDTIYYRFVNMLQHMIEEDMEFEIYIQKSDIRKTKDLKDMILKETRFESE